MDLAVAFVALVISGVSLGAAIRFGRALTEAQASLRQIQREHQQMQREHEQMQRELGELKAATEVLPAPPPLPKARPGGLDDLRQQLRQAHAEETDAGTEG